MAELDGGGFGDFIHDAWEKVGGTISAVVGAEVGAVAGSFIPLPGIGTLVGIAVGVILDAIADALQNDDDILGHKYNTLYMYSQKLSKYHKLGVVPPQKLENKTHHYTLDGHFTLDTSWRITKDQ